MKKLALLTLMTLALTTSCGHLGCKKSCGDCGGKEKCASDAQCPMKQDTTEKKEEVKK